MCRYKKGELQGEKFELQGAMTAPPMGSSFGENNKYSKDGGKVEILIGIGAGTV